MNLFPSFAQTGFSAQPNPNLLIAGLLGRSSLVPTTPDLLPLLNPQLQLLNQTNALAQLNTIGDDEVIMLDPQKKVKTGSNPLNQIGGFSAQENSNPQLIDTGIAQSDSRAGLTKPEKLFPTNSYPDSGISVKQEPLKKNVPTTEGFQQKDHADLDSDVSTATDISSRIEKRNADPLVVSEGLSLGLGNTPLGFSAQNQINPLLGLQADLLAPRQDINDISNRIQLLLAQQQLLSNPLNPMAMLAAPLIQLELQNQIQKLQRELLAQQVLPKLLQNNQINNLIQASNQINNEVQPPLQNLDNDPDLIILEDNNDKFSSKKKTASNITSFSNVTPNQGVKIEEKGSVMTRLKQKERIDEEPQADSSKNKTRQTRNMTRTNKEREEEDKFVLNENDNKKVNKVKEKQREKDSKKQEDHLSVDSDENQDTKGSPGTQQPKEKPKKVVPELTPPLKPMKKERKMNKLQEIRAIQEERMKEYENYVIKIHFDDKKKDNIVETRIGGTFQTALPEFDLNYRTPIRRPIKQVWNPESTDEAEIKEYFKALSEKNQGDVTNQERALKLLKKFDMDKEKVLDNISKNPLYYKNYFDINGYQTILRQRKDNN